MLPYCATVHCSKNHIDSDNTILHQFRDFCHIQRIFSQHNFASRAAACLQINSLIEAHGFAKPVVSRRLTLSAAAYCCFFAAWTEACR